MISSLLLLHARDSEYVKNDLLQELKGVPTCCVCIDDPKFYQSEALKHSSTSRLHIVFFSPGFLTFLECKPEEAYGSFKHLDPQSTFALFCCGLHEREVMCYHTAPLHSYNSWLKFEAVNEKDGRTGFSSCLLQIIEDAYTTNGFVDNVVIVPELISKDTDFIYIIFTNMLENKSELSVYLENSSSIQIVPEDVNPYVIKFKVPEMFLENSQTFTVKVQQSDTLLCQRTLRIIEDATVQETTPRKDLIIKRTTKIVKLDEQLQVLNDIVGMSLESLENRIGEGQKTMIQEDEEDATISLMKMCKKYGLEELSSFLGETSDIEHLTLVPNRFEEMFPIHQDCSAKQNNIFTGDKNMCSSSKHVNEVDAYSGITRSMSLPSVLPPEEECPNTSGDYLPMTFKHLRSGLSLLQSSDNLSLSESCVSNTTYVCMRRHSGNLQEAAFKGLSESQKGLLEAMRAYKAGRMTRSEVEEHFRLRQKKHGGHSNFSTDIEAEETCPDEGDFSRVWRRAKRKVSNASDWMKRFSGSSFQSRLSSLETYRKSSSASGSSYSSKASEASALTVQSQSHSGSSKSPRDSYTGLSLSYMLPEVCPLDTESNPPPLPIRPRPRSRSRVDPDEYLKSKDITRRKQDTHLPSDFNELTSRNQDINDKDLHDSDTLESLFEVCEKYGLEHLGDLFFREFYPDIQTKNVEPTRDKSMRGSELKNMINQSCLQLPSIKWDYEDPVTNKRPLSLPVVLFTKPSDEKNLVDDDIGKGKDFTMNQSAFPGNPANKSNKCEEYINSIQSNLYASIQAYISMNSQKDALQRNVLSKSQQELLELMNEFKRGEKTISQVEHQFQEWHRRNMETASTREEQLSQLKDQYEKAQKSSYFGIKKFILGKPKKKVSKTSTSSKPAKRNKKSDSEMKRLSKVSQTSTSSNVSDSSDVFKTFSYFNPAYGETTQEMPRKKIQSSKNSGCSSPRINPPPLPHRPPLTPAAIMKKITPKDDICDMETDKNLPTSIRWPKAKERPSPPPKPANLFQKVCGSESECCQEKEQDPETRPDSTIYIIPNKVVHVPSRKNLQLAKMGHSSEAHHLICPVSVAHVCAKAPFKPIFSSQAPKKKDETTGSNKVKQTDDTSSKRPVLQFPSPWLKSKKKEESMFYIARKQTRRCSSSPNLSGDLPSHPMYLNLQELCCHSQSGHKNVCGSNANMPPS